MEIIDLITFYRKAKTLNSIHSPFMYKFVSQIFEFNKRYYDDYRLEELRKLLLNDKTPLVIKDLGAGEKDEVTKTVAQVVKKSSSNKLKCKVLRNIVLFYKPKGILELGTNLGMATAYLATASSSASVLTVEGSEVLAAIANNNIRNRLRLKNVKIIQSSFDDFFASQTKNLHNTELVYLDGNHRYKSTMHYFDLLWNHYPQIKAIILDDINWSNDMKKAWLEITNRPAVHSLDIYKMGIAIRNEDISETIKMSCVPRIMKPWRLGLFG